MCQWLVKYVRHVNGGALSENLLLLEQVNRAMSLLKQYHTKGHFERNKRIQKLTII